MTEHAFSAARRQANPRVRQAHPAADGPCIGVPRDPEPVAILCLGQVPDFPHRPQLEMDEWTLGRPLSEFVSENGWPAGAPA